MKSRCVSAAPQQHPTKTTTARVGCVERSETHRSNPRIHHQMSRLTVRFGCASTAPYKTAIARVECVWLLEIAGWSGRRPQRAEAHGVAGAGDGWGVDRAAGDVFAGEPGDEGGFDEVGVDAVDGGGFDWRIYEP